MTAREAAPNESRWKVLCADGSDVMEEFASEQDARCAALDSLPSPEPYECGPHRVVAA